MLLERMVRAAKLDRELYYQLRRDQTANGQAFLVVLIVTACLLIGIGAPWYRPTFLIDMAIWAIGSWLFWVMIAVWVGKRRGGRADFEEVMRTTGFAYSPLAIHLFVLIPHIGLPLLLIGWLWSIVARVVAIREAMGFATGRAVQTVVLTSIFVTIIEVLLCKLTGATAGMVGIILSQLGFK